MKHACVVADVGNPILIEHLKMMIFNLW